MRLAIPHSVVKSKCWSRRLLSILTLCLINQTGWADVTSELKAFYTTTSSMSARFQQTVTDKQGRKVQEVSGHMLLQRPNMFRWDYDKPYEQQIISDGNQVFLYDTDLQQVTIRTLGQALGASPAALLAGDDNVAQIFTLKQIVRKDKQNWISATPKNKESGFEHVYLRFDHGQLLAMEMLDSFGQTTSIRFNQVDLHPQVKAEQFLFKMPHGVDVVSE